jgi:hypothetical protein
METLTKSEKRSFSRIKLADFSLVYRSLGYVGRKLNRAPPPRQLRPISTVWRSMQTLCRFPSLATKPTHATGQILPHDLAAFLFQKSDARAMRFLFPLIGSFATISPPSKRFWS